MIVSALSQLVSHLHRGCADELGSFFSFLHRAGPLQPRFGLVNFQMNNLKCSLTLSASRHHIHPFIVDSKCKKVLKPSALPKVFRLETGIVSKSSWDTAIQKYFFTHN